MSERTKSPVGQTGVWEKNDWRNEFWVVSCKTVSDGADVTFCGRLFHSHWEFSAERKARSPTGKRRVRRTQGIENIGTSNVVMNNDNNNNNNNNKFILPRNSDSTIHLVHSTNVGSWLEIMRIKTLKPEFHLALHGTSPLCRVCRDVTGQVDFELYPFPSLSKTRNASRSSSSLSVSFIFFAIMLMNSSKSIVPFPSYIITTNELTQHNIIYSSIKHYERTQYSNKVKNAT